MKFTEWKPGASLCFSRRCDTDFFREMKAAGLECAELSFSYDDYFNRLRFPENAQEIKDNADAAGIELWSIHLPFGHNLNISSPDEEMRDFTLNTDKALIAAAAKIGVKVAVIHPCTILLEEDERAGYLDRARKVLAGLAAYARELGMRLAMENLPHTLVRDSKEALYVLDGNPDLYMVFDTNHCLVQDNTEFINAVGERIITLHVSDYDFINEKHLLPFDGKNDWKSILTALENKGYTGPWMYEVGSKHGYSLNDFTENLRRLAAL